MSSEEPNSAGYNGDIIIAVMGITGVGKSSFISTLTGRKDIVGHDLSSETSEVKSYRFSYGSNNYVLVDTPGFDDSTMSNEEVTAKILKWLHTSYGNGIRLHSVIYIHNITKPRIQGSAYRNMRLFRKLCGDGALGNVFLATSFWDLVTPSVGAKRESELKNSKDFWADMVAKGSEVVRISPDRLACLEVLDRITAKIIQAPGQSIPVNTCDLKIQELDKSLAREREAERERLRKKLEEGQIAHEKDKERLRAQEREIRRQMQESEEHERIVREDLEKMQRERRGRGERQKRREQRERRERGGRRGLEEQVDSRLLNHSQAITNCLYGLACFWTIFPSALLGSVLNDSSEDAPAQVNFCMFVTVVSWLSSIFGLLLGLLGSPNNRIPIVTDAFAVLWTFLAAVSLTSKLAVSDCLNDDFSADDSFTNVTRRCQELWACAAFFWFLFVTYCVELAWRLWRRRYHV